MPDKRSNAAESLVHRVGVRQARMIRRRQQGLPGFWQAVTMVGAIGWPVALGTVIGSAVGTWIDHRWPSRFSWTVTLLFAGLVLGCVEAWGRIKSAQEER